MRNSSSVCRKSWVQVSESITAIIRKWIEMTEMPESHLQHFDCKGDQDVLPGVGTCVNPSQSPGFEAWVFLWLIGHHHATSRLTLLAHAEQEHIKFVPSSIVGKIRPSWDLVGPVAVQPCLLTWWSSS